MEDMGAKKIPTVADLDIFPAGGLVPVYAAACKRLIKRAWFRRFGAACPICRQRMTFDRAKHLTWNIATIDHIKARSAGGTDAPGNIQVICRGCNAAKSRVEGAAAVARIWDKGKGEAPAAG
jgi:5-methylcytosine-specific restriction endonuclease McrA